MLTADFQTIMITLNIPCTVIYTTNYTTVIYSIYITVCFWWAIWQL